MQKKQMQSRDTLNKLEREGNFLNLIKSIYKNPELYIST